MKNDITLGSLFDGSDSARYRMWGNGLALPCAADVMGRIAKEEQRARESHT